MIEVGPVNVLAPESVSVPAPVLVIPKPAPPSEMIEEIAAVPGHVEVAALTQHQAQGRRARAAGQGQVRSRADEEQVARRRCLERNCQGSPAPPRVSVSAAVPVLATVSAVVLRSLSEPKVWLVLSVKAAGLYATPLSKVTSLVTEGTAAVAAVPPAPVPGCTTRRVRGSCGVGQIGLTVDHVDTPCSRHCADWLSSRSGSSQGSRAARQRPAQERAGIQRGFREGNRTAIHKEG